MKGMEDMVLRCFQWVTPDFTAKRFYLTAHASHGL